MASIMDIGPLSASVALRGVELSINGIGSDAIVVLLQMFPDLHRAIGMRKEMNAADFMKLGPDIVAAVIAVGTGYDVTDEVIAKIKTFSIGEQMSLIAPILKLTFPQGFGPFVDALTEVVEGASQAGQSGKVPVTN
jgi:hypothetical protein